VILKKKRGTIAYACPEGSTKNRAQSKATPTLAAQAFAHTSLCTLKFCRFTGQEYLANANYVDVFKSLWGFVWRTKDK
jgi:hypothetical protein